MKTTILEFKQRYPKLILKFEKETEHHAFWNNKITGYFIHWLCVKINKKKRRLLKEKLYKEFDRCVVCGKYFDSAYGVAAHIRWNHKKYYKENVYVVIHNWVRRYKPKPKNCDICGLPDNYENLGKLELSNKTGKLIWDLNNFQYVHRICHKQYDKKNNIIHERINKLY